MAAWCSIVIPARNDAAALAQTLDALDGLHGRAGVDLIAQGPRPQLQQAKSKCDKNAR